MIRSNTSIDPRIPSFNGIIVAAGSGERLGVGVPKALVLLDGQPIIWHAVNGLVTAGCGRCVVVVPGYVESEFHQVLDESFPQISVIVGGETRQESVYLGLANLKPNNHDIVLIHDAARPLTPVELIGRVTRAVAAGARAVVPGIPVVDSLRKSVEHGSQGVERANLWQVQTPQGFLGETLIQAHQTASDRGINATDDASVAELLGIDVQVVPGAREAMKITEPFDLEFAKYLISRKGN